MICHFYAPLSDTIHDETFYEGAFETHFNKLFACFLGTASLSESVGSALYHKWPLHRKKLQYVLTSKATKVRTFLWTHKMFRFKMRIKMFNPWMIQNVQDLTTMHHSDNSLRPPLWDSHWWIRYNEVFFFFQPELLRSTNERTLPTKCKYFPSKLSSKRFSWCLTIPTIWKTKDYNLFWPLNPLEVDEACWMNANPTISSCLSRNTFAWRKTLGHVTCRLYIGVALSYIE